MSNRAKKPSLLSKDFSILFSPLRIDADFLDGKVLALYKFSTIFFPNLGSGLLNILLDMEKHSRRVIASIKLQERESLIKELGGVTVEIRYMVKDKGKEMIILPINISPSEVLKNATLVKQGSRYNKKMQEEINKILISFIKKEIERKIKTMVEDFLKTLLVKPKMPPMLKELLSRGLINKEGRLAEGTTIEDLISGRYARLFKKVVPEELINEALLIRDTIKTFYDWKDEDYQSLANEALVEKGILEITLGEVAKNKNYKEKGGKHGN